MSSTSRTPSRGLPNNPRPRAKSAAAPPSRQPPPEPRALPTNPRSRQLPPQNRARAPEPIPKNHLSRRVASPSANNARSSDEYSTSSNSSSGSSFWSRGNSISSTASSRITLDNEGDGHYRESSQDAYLQSKGAKDTNTSESSVDPKELAGLAWGRVTEVANVFTQEVSKVWATGLTPLGGHRAVDEGQVEESHLTRVMRAYHLSKAQSPSDLPDWLFSERERGQLGGSLRPELRNDGSRGAAGPVFARSRNLSDNDYSSTRSSATRLKNIQNFPTSMPGTLPPTKATGADRLKMIRDRRALHPTERS